MGDAPGLGTAGSVGDHVLGNERDNAEVARALGLKRAFIFSIHFGISSATARLVSGLGALILRVPRRRRGAGSWRRPSDARPRWCGRC
jgi:hypothetical protein